jgi:hypothetical protein
MSDFLDMLTADRSTSSPVLKPAIPSRFERAASWTAPTRSEDAVGSQEERVVPFVERFPSTRSSIRPDASHEGRFDAELPQDYQPTYQHYKLEESVRSLRPETPSPTLPAEGRRPGIPNSSLTSPAHDDSMAERVAELAAGLRALQGVQESGQPRPPAVDRHHTETNQRSEGKTLPDSAPPVYSEPRVRTPPRIVAERLPSLAKSSGSDNPTVNVTIGRVEVKAVQENKPEPVRAEPRSRVMSLEQYLQRRAAGASA